MLMMLAGFGITLAHMMPEQMQSRSQRAEAVFPAWNSAEGSDLSGFRNTGLAPIVPWLAPFWIAGVSLIYLRCLASCLWVQRLRRRGVCCAPEYWQKELARLGARLRIMRPIVLLESCLADVPMVLGHFRPLILVPIGVLAGLSPLQVEAVLLHELAHIRRHDYLVNMLQRLVEGVLFYHPAIWWISRLMRAERENCCDDVAVSISGNAREYADALAVLEQNRLSGLEPEIAATGGNLVKRIHRLLYPARSSGAWAPFLVVAIFVTTGAVSLAAWQAKPAQNSSLPVQMQADEGPNSRYSKWLNEDVAYIINDTERAAFLRLKTDEERDKFVEQFWLRRDPTPGTSRNKFKEEHYRRIAYANAHFASAIPGWKTDRGHMYIVYGPPDEMEDHPLGNGKPYAIEVWLYHHIDGIGDNLTVTFIRSTGDNDFRLAPGNSPAKVKKLSMADPWYAEGNQLAILSGNMDGKQPDKMMLARAQQAMKDASYVEARGLFETLIQSHPNSEYVPLAKLSIGDAWYAEGNVKQAEVEYRDFLTFFPKRPEAAEVQSKLASIQSNQ
jgi:GWxTD domain-containing protein